METNYHTMNRTDLTKFSGLVNLYRSLKGRCHGKKLLGQFGEICPLHFHSSHWHSKTDWNIATPMGALTEAMTHLHLQAFNKLLSRCRGSVQFDAINAPTHVAIWNANWCDE